MSPQYCHLYESNLVYKSTLPTPLTSNEYSLEGTIPVVMSSDITFVDTFLCNSIKESKESLCDKFINGPPPPSTCTRPFNALWVK